MERIEVARRFVERIVAEFRPHVKQVILFGSVAEKRDNKDSDIDLIMVTDDKSIGRGIYNVVGDFILEYNELPAPIVYTQKEFAQRREYSFQREALKKGVILYGG